MSAFVQQVVNGVAIGGIYGLIAVGYTMVYGIVGMINFAHGEVYMVGAFIALVGFVALAMAGVTSVPLAIVVVLLAAVIVTAVYGWAVERIAYRPLRGSFKLAPLISAIGVSIFLQNGVALLQGARVKSMPPLVHGGLDIGSAAFPITVSYLQLVVVGVTVLLVVGLTWMLASTPLGRAQRACEQDMTMAALVGIDVDRTIAVTFVMGAGLAAVAGTMVLLYYGTIDFMIGFVAGVKAFSAAVLGGIGSLPGAILGGLLIGLIEAFWSGYVGVEYKDVAVFAILILVLIVRPAGLLGRPEMEKV
ncbi:branched-chain amino acid ABC transporter permease LivH [Reyranella sp. CPCC 100927]|uniref:ABC transporter permease subunit n=1 Tax=Reyranella sp. CPCC 100927 TaxID=2599616 RepID=UPI0011B4B72D|nr:branched-chain amino acid ABC transporter permease LivH [Reyranella sp. CPCC 100927]TWT04070.1 branched-chain amino acid ABC transporter permease LivH [Reyranella sp. CPCC 100927]